MVPCGPVSPAPAPQSQHLILGITASKELSLPTSALPLAFRLCPSAVTGVCSLLCPPHLIYCRDVLSFVSVLVVLQCHVLVVFCLSSYHSMEKPCLPLSNSLVSCMTQFVRYPSSGLVYPGCPPGRGPEQESVDWHPALRMAGIDCADQLGHEQQLLLLNHPCGLADGHGQLEASDLVG